MSWTAKDPGIYSRPLGATEQGMLAAILSDIPPSREFIKIHCVATFNASDTSEKVIDALRDAWKALRLLRSPDIATSFADGQKIYQVLATQELETWVNETFIVADVGKTVNTAVRDMQLCPSYLPSCAVLPQSTSDRSFQGSLIMFISHWRTEAAGVLKMIDQLFNYADDLLHGSKTRQALSSHVTGSEVKLLTPTLDDILMPNKEPSPDAKSRVEKNFADYYSKLPCIGFPMTGELTATPSFMKVNQRTYTPASTSSIISRCKSEGITVTSAAHAAFLDAVWKVSDPSQKSLHYASMMPAQTRTRLPTSSPYRDNGCWDSARMLMLTSAPDLDFVTRARGLKQQYALAGTDSWLYDDIRQIPIQMGSPPPNLPQSSPSLPWFTSIGLLDGEIIVSEHGGIHVDHLTFWADSMLPGIVLRLWTFRHRLNIQIQWNVAFHSDELIEKTLNLIEGTLAKDLGAQIDVERQYVEKYNG